MDHNRLGKMIAATALMASSAADDFDYDLAREVQRLQLRNRMRPPSKAKPKSKAVLKRRKKNRAARKQRKSQ